MAEVGRSQSTQFVEVVMKTKTSEASVDVEKRIAGLVQGTFREAGVIDYCFGLSIDRVRSYYAAGEKFEIEDIARLPYSWVHMGCLFKPFLATLALDLSTRGGLDLSTPIGNYIPELASDKKGEMIQIRHLITHTQGFAAFDRAPPAQRFRNREVAISQIKAAQLIFWPGAVFSHDHSVTAILGEILENVTGRSVPDLVAEALLSPLGVTDVMILDRGPETFQQSSDYLRAKSDAQSLFNTALIMPDALSLVESLMSGRAHESKVAVLSTEVLDMLTTCAIRIPRTAGSAASQLLPSGYGSGIQLFRNRFFGYDSSTRLQANGFRCDPERRIACVLATRGEFRSGRRVILSHILDLLDDLNGSAANQEESSEHSDLSIEDLVGDYFGAQSFSATVRRVNRGGVFSILMRRGGRIEMRGEVDRNGHVSFTSKVPGTEPTFFRDPRTSETCVMYGNFALKRMPTAVIR